MRTAVITGGTKGLGRAMVERLVADGWSVVFDARRRDDVREAQAAINGNGHPGSAIGIAGDIADGEHREVIADAISGSGLDLLVNNASTLGPTPLPRLTDLDPGDLRGLFETNLVAPLALTQRLIEPLDHARGVVVNISSDAAVETYAGWGGYGATKAALDHITAVLTVEHPSIAWYAFDPGDMRTDMHQAAFPGEDISDRPSPHRVVPSLLRLFEMRPPPGRYTESDLSARQAIR